MKNISKRVFSILLALIMIVGLIPSFALAESSTTSEEIPGGTNVITITVNTSGNVETTTTTENWNSSLDGTQTVGSSTTTETVIDGDGATRVETEVEGQETTTTTGTVTNTTTVENVTVQGSDAPVEIEEEGSFVSDGSGSNDENKNDGSWTLSGTSADPDGFSKVEGSDKAQTSASTPVDTQLNGSNFLEGDAKVDLWMTPEASTDSESVKLDEKYYTVEILPEDIKAALEGLSPDENGVYTLADGRTVTQSNIDGKLSYTVLSTTPIAKEELSDAEKAKQDKNASSSSETVGEVYYNYYDSSLEDTYTAVPKDSSATERTEASSVDGYSTVVETVKDAEGNIVKEVRREPVRITISDKDGASKEVIAYEVTETSYSPYEGIVGTEDVVVEDRSELPKALPAPAVVSKGGENTAVSFESILDENGNHIGYKATTTVTDKDGGIISASDEVLSGDSYSYVADTNGELTTTVTITKLEKDGQHIGYTTSTVVTDAKGNIVSSSSDSVEQTTFTEGSGTLTKYGQTQVNTKKTRIIGSDKMQDLKITSNASYENVSSQDITQEVYQMVETPDGIFLLYNSKLYNITGSYTVKDPSFIATGGADGSVDINGYMNSNANDDLRKKAENDAQPAYKGNYTGNIFGNEAYDNFKGYEWNYIGYGMVSDFQGESNTDKNYEDRSRIRQFMLQDKNGQIIFAYCVEMGAEIAPDNNYKEHVYEKTESDNATELEAGGTIAHLRSIAANGFWGTESGIGSLQAVKDLMERNNLGQYADIMTEGMAQLATQIAIWEYGKDKKATEVFGNPIYDKDGNPTGERTDFDVTYFNTNTNIDSNKQKAINELRNLLLRLANDPDEGQSEIITKDNITGAGVVLNDYKGQTESGDHVYNTDVKFGLDVSTSSLNGDLIVKIVVYDEDNKETVVGKARLAGDNEHTLFGSLVDSAFKTIHPDDEGIFTIENVELAEGVPFTIKLDGVQQLDDGLYILKDYNTNDYWQDYISLTKQDVDIDVSMTLSFDVKDDPNKQQHKAKLTTDGWTEEKVDTEYFTKIDSGVRTDKGSWQSSGEGSKIIGYTATVTAQTKTVKESSEWSSNSTQIFIDPPLMPYGGDGEIIEEEPVPLAKAPGTGSSAWIIVLAFLFSGCGIVALNLKKRKEN